MAISNILTLRYDPQTKEYLKKATWHDFIEKKSENFENQAFSLLNKTIQQISLKQKHIVVALSAGIDSSLVLALLKQNLSDVKITALTLTFSQSEDESNIASDIANFFNVEHKVIHVNNFLKELPAALHILNNPHYDIMNTYYLVKNSSKISNILVTGDGGDEIFGGYTFRYSRFTQSVTDKSTVQEKIHAYLNCHERDWVPDQEHIFGKKMNFSWEQIYNHLRPYFDNPLSKINQVLLADYNGKLLHNFIPNYRKFYDFFKVKSFSPFLNEKIIDFGLHLPMSQKYNPNNNLGKLLLRNLLNQKLPETLRSPVKQGFSVNTVSLWDEFGSEICKNYLFDSRVVKDKWVNIDWIKKNFSKADDEKNVRYINKFFSLLGFEIWYRLFITNEINSNSAL